MQKIHLRVLKLTAIIYLLLLRRPYEKVMGIAERYNAELIWLEEHQSHYALWNHDGVFEYAFIEDARSIQPKLDLLQRYDLRGISVWRLGQEDPAVWEEIEQNLNINSSVIKNKNQS